jgi:hypothetical protein
MSLGPLGSLCVRGEIPLRIGSGPCTNFDKMLSAVKGSGHPFLRIKGILIIADSHDNPKDTLRIILPQIRGECYPTPTTLMEIAPSTADYPAVAITLLPDDESPGSLETLFIQAILSGKPWLSACVTAYLTCDKIAALGWTPEKLDKARYHSMVAATHFDDPSRAAAYAFRDPPVIEIENEAFRNIASRIKDFCVAVGAWNVKSN